MRMNGPEQETDADHPDVWPELEAVMQEIETKLSAANMSGDPTAPWEGVEDQAVVTISGALLKTLCDVAAQAEGVMEWRSDDILLHSGMRAPVPLRFQASHATD
jgi:hypothetical protein